MDIRALTFDERDEFSRKSIAKKVISVLQSNIDISPMIIDGGWGTGKTEFCHKLINLMHNDDGYHLIYVDAFQADHANEPLLTVLAEVIKVLPTDKEQKSFTKKVLPFLKFGIKTIAKSGVAHALRQDTASVVDDFDKDLQKAADIAIDATVESILKTHIEADKNLIALQSALATIASHKSIILFIDELDRCRPDFAMNMLEVIKHTFDVKGVQFVLITNTQQLKASINHSYGHAVDAHRYLDKFIKFRFELSPLSSRELSPRIIAAKQHFFYLAKESRCLPLDCLNDSYFEKAIDHLISYHSLSLREIETLILHIQIAQNLSNSKQFGEKQFLGYTLLRLIVIMLACYRPELLNELKKENLDADLLGGFLGVKSIPELDRMKRPSVIEVMMVIFAIGCNKNTEKYILTKDQKEKWDLHINESFMRFTPNKNEIITALIETANIMTFE